MRIDQILCAAGPVDAVTNQALAYRRLLGSWGWDGEDYAPVQAAGMARGAVRPLQQLRPGAADLVVLHYSGYAPGVDELLARCPRSLLISHNITPADHFWAVDPAEAVRCQLARTQLARLGSVAGALAGVSEFNARELSHLAGREVGVIPVLFDRGRLPVGSSNAVGPTGLPVGSCDAAGPTGVPAGPPDAAGPTVLFVGRLVPHKRQDLVIRAFAGLREAMPEVRLTLVGTPLSPEFAGGLRRLAGELAPGAVSFESSLPDAELWQRYRRAGAFLCLSEHEGFGIPLLEAFHFGVPVIARDAGAVGEVVGDAGVLLADGDGVAVAAEVLATVMRDAELRVELAGRGARRLEQYAFHRVAAALRAQLEEVAA
jgi:glycosyltransferase involved in cell wall biosynthesis